MSRGGGADRDAHRDGGKSVEFPDKTELAEASIISRLAVGSNSLRLRD